MLYLRTIPLALLLFFLAGCSSKGPETNTVYSSEVTMRPYVVHGKKYYPERVSVGQRQRGLASWYGDKFHGRKTSNGEVYDMHGLSAAHKTYPMNTMVKVRNLNNNKTVVVRINDRGPFVSGRIIDLSKTAAKGIDLIAAGTAPVEIEVVGFSGKVMESKSDSKPLVYNGGVFLVQIGAFRNYSGALNFKERYDGFDGYRAEIKRFDIDEMPIFRVFLRGFRSESEANDFKKAEHFEGAFIVRE